MPARGCLRVYVVMAGSSGENQSGNRLKPEAPNAQHADIAPAAGIRGGSASRAQKAAWGSSNSNSIALKRPA